MSHFKDNKKIFGDRAVQEFRAIKKGGTPAVQLFHSNVYDGFDDMWADIERFAQGHNSQYYNLYGVMNTCRDDLYHKSVTDADIAYRNWLLIDIDRAYTAKCPASDDEIEHAKRLANQIKHFMSEQGWPDPLEVMSGNGVHLYYDLNRMESDDEATTLIKTFLNLLADYFDNQYVKVDRSVYNASRITKVLGTIARKGEESTERPYREASLI